MNATVPSIQIPRTRLLAVAGAAVATASVAVTLAVAPGAGDHSPAAPVSAAGGAPAIDAPTAQPDPAKAYRYSLGQPSPPSPTQQARRFHHFR
jgi:hypothetical protein